VVTPGVQFLIAPQDVPLLATGRNAGPISLSVDFTGLGHISGAKVRFRHAGLAAADPSTELTLTREGSTNRFTGTIAAGAYAWSTGSQTFEAIGQAGVNDVSATAAVTFLAPGFVPDPEVAPVVTQATVSPASVVVGRQSNVNDRLCAAFTVEARIDGLGPDSTVTATYKPGGSASITMTPVSTPISASSAVFRATFARHAASAWSPTPSAPGDRGLPDRRTDRRWPHVDRHRHQPDHLRPQLQEQRELLMTNLRRGERGFTFVELLVVMVLLGIVGGVVVNAVTTSLRSASHTTARVKGAPRARGRAATDLP
jgi:prepilin-type N-terminal cleavage/methylation domain-containing protein